MHLPFTSKSFTARSTPLMAGITPKPGISGIDHLVAVAALQDAGFWILGQGAHVVMTNGTRVLTIPCQDPVNALTLAGIVRDSGLTAEEFRQLL